MDTQDRRQRPREVRDQAARLLRRPAAAEGRRPGQAGGQGHRHGRPHRDGHQDLPGQRPADPGEPDPRGRPADAGHGEPRLRGGHLPRRQPGRRCEVKFWQGNEAKGKPLATVKTNDAGLAEFKLTPKTEQFRAGRLGPAQHRNARRQSPRKSGGRRAVFDLTAEAKDAKGNTAKPTADAEQRAAGRERAAAAGQGHLQGRRLAEGRRAAPRPACRRSTSTWSAAARPC